MRNKVIYLLLLVLLLLVFPACNSKSEGPLPHSMKGYELYSWQEQAQWHFTLITGTNRNKTLEEIVTGDNVESKDGWVRIHAVGVDNVKALLSRVPASDWVSWLGGGWIEPEKQVDIKLTLPPQEIIDTVKEHAEKCGLNFMAQ